MKGLVVVLAMCLLAPFASATQEWQWANFEDEVEDTAFLEMDDPAVMGYIPSSVPFDNPATLSERTPTIPSAPDCTIRPQTIVEIKRMRASAARIAQMIQQEVIIMEKRKTYIEQMTSYLNDRIRELNKVKGELEQENRWIEVSNQRIAELAQKEKLIKMQDILACLNSDETRLKSHAKSHTATIKQLQTQAKTLQTSIDTIKKNINAVNSGKGEGAATTAAAS